VSWSEVYSFSADVTTSFAVSASSLHRAQSLLFNIDEEPEDVQTVGSSRVSEEEEWAPTLPNAGILTPRSLEPRPLALLNPNVVAVSPLSAIKPRPSWIAGSSENLSGKTWASTHSSDSFLYEPRESQTEYAEEEV